MPLLEEHGLFMATDETVAVELVYIKPDQQTVLKLELPSGSTIETAITKSKILQRHPEIDLAVNKVGIYNRIKSIDYVLKHRDRIEIYRPLQADPKEARRRRAKEKSG